MSSGGAGPKLTPEEIVAITACLEDGAYLDDLYRSRLFRQPKEPVLTYAGKTPPGIVLAETMGVPFQTFKRFGSNGGDWTNLLIQGDNLQVLKTLLEMKRRGELKNADGSDGFRLCYIDPPFATRREFRGKQGQVAYADKVEGAEFVEFLRKRLIFIYELLAEDGTLYMHLDTKKVHAMKLVLDELFGEGGFRNEIIWKRSDAHSDTLQGAQDFGRIHDTILRYTKETIGVFNTEYLPLPETTAESWYRNIEDGTGRRYNKADLTAAKPGGDTSYEFNGVRPPAGRYWAYSKAKIKQFQREDRLVYTKSGRPYMKRYLDESRGVPLQDLWTDIGMLRGITQDSERSGYPTQKPLELLRRIIKVSSNPGDLCLDCFAGAGTAAIAAEELDRRWVAVDCGKLAVYITQKRLLSMRTGKGKAAKSRATKPFELCAAGHYDNTLLEALPFEKWEPFCLELFGCRAEPQTIGGVRMSGKRKGDPVHTFPFNETNGEMGELYLKTLHGRLRGKVSGVVYVIAPTAACDPGLFQDLLTFDKTSYFILRVPYSVIKALHERDFQQPGQPMSESQVNDALDAYGFDFVEVPEVEVSYSLNGSTLSGRIESFRRGGLDPEEFTEFDDAGRSDLAMLMADTSYDGDVFKVSDHFFSEDLAAMHWEFQVETTPDAHRALLVFMDVLGNERRETVKLADLRTAPRKRGTARRNPARAA